ncbi:MAG: carboxypeptidase regulatory-like domain-containing protein [Acidobacteriota bacterium]
MHEEMGRSCQQAGTWWGVALVALVISLLAPANAWAGSISGRVIDQLTGEPLSGITVRQAGGFPSGVTDAEGNYTIQGINGDGGLTWFYIADPPGYVGQIYGGLDCFFPDSPHSCPVFDGDLVFIDTDQPSANINFALRPEARISGVVSDQNGPLQGATVRLGLKPTADSLEPAAANTLTAADGSYSFGSLPGEEFVVSVEAPDYASELWPDVPCGLFCDPREGEPILLSEGEEVSGIDFLLGPELSISGSVRSEETGEPLGDVNLLLYLEDGEVEGLAQTLDDGTYRIEGIRPGTYFLRSLSKGQYPSMLYDGSFCELPEGLCDVTQGTPVVVSAGINASDIDFRLPVGGRITGTVLNELGERVSAVLKVGGLDDRFWVSPVFEGEYEIDGLAPGNYVVYTQPDLLGYRSQVYPGIPCAEGGECDLDAGTPISVELGETVGGIDFVLERSGNCEPTAERLCLNEGRFAVEVDWMTPAGTVGKGKGGRLPDADDSGFFWFFNKSNAEMLVKVLNGCNTPFNSYWVFTAGLTNVEVTITVTDTATGEVWTSINPLGSPFQPEQDTQAFKTCP